MRIRRLLPSELDWANRCYAQIDFVPAAAADFVVVAEVDGARAGLGRVVAAGDAEGELGGMYVLPAFRGRALAPAIVEFLAAHCGLPSLYCVPFAHLEQLYRRCGFARVDPAAAAPRAILHKLAYCRGHYPTPVILMHRRAAG